MKKSTSLFPFFQYTRDSRVPSLLFLFFFWKPYARNKACNPSSHRSPQKIFLSPFSSVPIYQEEPLVAIAPGKIPATSHSSFSLPDARRASRNTTRIASSTWLAHSPPSALPTGFPFFPSNYRKGFAANFSSCVSSLHSFPSSFFSNVKEWFAVADLP